MSDAGLPAVTGNEIAIVAMAGRVPGARDVEAFWRNLREGVESIRFFTDDEMAAAGLDPATFRHPAYVPARGVVDGADELDAELFGFSAAEARATDPQQRVFLECCWEALERAGYDSERFRRPIGVYAGVGASGYGFHVYADSALVGAVGEFQALLGNDKDYLASRVAYKLDLTGPAVVIQTACSTSLVAIHFACQGLLTGECDLALAGGVAIKVPQESGYLHREGGIGSPDGHCRAFDADARGTVGSSGVGVVALKRLEDVAADGDQVLAVIRGSAVNNDGGAKIGYTAPAIGGQSRVVRLAHAVAEVDPATIGYVETHGTGTALGDPIEIAALEQAFRSGGCEGRGFCSVGSVKTNIGHLDTAAGVAGVIKTVQALRHGEIPPSLHFEAPNPEIPFAESCFRVNAVLSPWERTGGPRRAGVSSFGIGGTNAHVVLEEAPPRPAGSPAPGPHLLLLAARTASALDVATRRLADHLEAHPDEALADVAYTLQVGRRRLAHRRAILVEEGADPVAALRTPGPRRSWSRTSAATARPVVFLLPGQGSQHVEMARGLYAAEPRFRESFDRCAALLEPLLGLDLREALWPPGVEEGDASAEARLRRSELAQPALFAVEYSLARLWMEWGVEPAAMVGHSVGELVAACLAGTFGLDDALRLIVLRGRRAAA
jgi:acyl transferase domain-containing protein